MSLRPDPRYADVGYLAEALTVALAHQHAGLVTFRQLADRTGLSPGLVAGLVASGRRRLAAGDSVDRPTSQGDRNGHA